MKRIINQFRGENRFLSNFWPAEVEYLGITFPTVEHAYQAAKFIDPDIIDDIANLSTPGKAKREVQKYAIERVDWDDIKSIIMIELVEKKFQIPELKDMLIATGDAELVEGNTWGDTYWGVCGGKGENMLGKILMEVRKNLND